MSDRTTTSPATQAQTQNTTPNAAPAPASALPAELLATAFGQEATRRGPQWVAGLLADYNHAVVLDGLPEAEYLEGLQDWAQHAATSNTDGLAEYLAESDLCPEPTPESAATLDPATAAPAPGDRSLAAWTKVIFDPALKADAKAHAEQHQPPTEQAVCRLVAEAGERAAQTAEQEEVCGGPRVLVRPLKTKDGFSVHTENRGDEHTGNTYPVVLTAKINPDTRGIRFNPLDHRATPIITAFNKNLGLLRQHQVSAALVEILKRLGGTTHLRDTGGIYWLPDSRLAEWREAARAVECSAHEKPSAVYILRHDLDPDAVRAVRDAIVAEVTLEAKAIQDEIISGNLGERALANRQAAAEALAEKIALYEGLLDVGLDDLKAAADEASQAAAAAVLLAGAAAANGETVPA